MLCFPVGIGAGASFEMILVTPLALIAVLLAVLHQVVRATGAWKWYGVDQFRRRVLTFYAAIDAITDGGGVLGVGGRTEETRGSFSPCPISAVNIRAVLTKLCEELATVGSRDPQ